MADDFVKRGPGRPRKDSYEPVYQPKAEAPVAPAPVKRNFRSEVKHHVTLVFDVNGQELRGVVRDFNRNGVYVRPPEMKHIASLNQCTFWRWDEFENHIKDIISTKR
jgi:hypothetical protein